MAPTWAAENSPSPDQIRPAAIAESTTSNLGGGTDPRTIQPVADVPVPPVDLGALPAQRGRPQTRGAAKGRRPTWDSAPYLVGDGCAAEGSSSQLSLGRIMIEAQGLAPIGGGLIGPGPGQLNLITAPQYNSIQAISGAGYPSFTLPSQSLGAAPGTSPVSLSGTGIGGVADPGPNYQNAAQNAFETNPALPGTNGRIGTATFDQAGSGSLASSTAGQQDAFLYYDYIVRANASVIFPGYAIGLVKATENMSIVPRDRVYMNYSYFYQANIGGLRADVNRFTPGFEKTFLDGWTSIEIRTPFAATLANAQDVYFPAGGDTARVSEYRDVQFGNMSVLFKTLLWEHRTWAITGGIQVMMPTAQATSLNGPTAAGGNIQQVYFGNESVLAMPFIGSIWAPNERFFNQALLQVATDCNGNPVYVNSLQDPSLSGRSMTYAGRAYYPTFMYLSFGTGYWLYKDNTANFTGFSPIFELHVNQGLGAFDPVCYQNWQIGQSAGVVSVTNALIGCNFEWGTRGTLTFAYVTPLGGGVDRFFNGEFRALYNWRFGRQNRLTRAQF